MRWLPCRDGPHDAERVVAAFIAHIREKDRALRHEPKTAIVRSMHGLQGSADVGADPSGCAVDESMTNAKHYRDTSVEVQ
jgi:hypothetical protein